MLVSYKTFTNLDLYLGKDEDEKVRKWLKIHDFVHSTWLGGALVEFHLVGRSFYPMVGCS